MSRTSTDASTLARDLLGLTKLRPGQQDAIESILAGRDTLVVMPTGAGKSAIYQTAALAQDRPAVVVSPLIALQRDQVEALQAAGAPLAVQLNSTQSAGERATVLEALHQGTVRVVFLSPEQLANEESLAAIVDTQPSLFVVDEAHCISSWGHDFRPEYLNLAAAAQRVGRPAILALTATASPLVRGEIVERLEMSDPCVIVQGFDRPNLHLDVRRFTDERRKLEALEGFVRDVETPGIVYVATRKKAEEIAGALWSSGISAVHYHGGMKRAERDASQGSFMDDDFQVVVATTAFGMGIDKPDVRFVVHYDIPESVDAYYQEIGRAGRDGEPAATLLLYRSEDLGVRRFFAAAAKDDESRRRLEESRLDMMRAFAETTDCRRGFLLNYFGEAFSPPCGNCDNCDRGLAQASDAQRPFPLESRVVHGTLGSGAVVRYEGDKVTVLFDEEGYRTLSIETVVERGLLRPAE